MRLHRSLPALAASAVLLGCSTELDINAPYKENTVVYGLLNMRDEVHFVKVNKSFLGEGDANVYALIPDSNEYRGEDISRAMVYKITGGVRVDSFPLRDTLITNREPGTFNHPQQRLYYFRERNSYTLPQSAVTVHLEQNSEYELDLVVKGRRITAIAPIVNDFSIFSTIQSPVVEVNLMAPGGGYGAYEIKWNTGRDGKRYEISYRFNYDEVRNNDTISRSILQRVGSRVSASSQSSEAMSIYMGGEQFFSTLANTIPDDPAVTKRIFTGLDFLFTVANDDFHTFLSLSEPVSGIVEERPAYSNVGNAYGVFASRYTKNVIGKRLHAVTLLELRTGPYTSRLRFCALPDCN